MFKKTMNSCNYSHLILTPLSTELTEKEQIYSYFMQLCATAHAAQMLWKMHSAHDSKFEPI